MIFSEFVNTLVLDQIEQDEINDLDHDGNEIKEELIENGLNDDEINDILNEESLEAIMAKKGGLKQWNALKQTLKDRKVGDFLLDDPVRKC